MFLATACGGKGDAGGESLPPTVDFPLLGVPELAELERAEPDVWGALLEISHPYWTRGDSQRSISLSRKKTIGTETSQLGSVLDWKIEVRRLEIEGYSRVSEETLTVQLDVAREYRLSEKKIDEYLEKIGPFGTKAPPPAPEPTRVTMIPYRAVCHAEQGGAMGACAVEGPEHRPLEITWGGYRGPLRLLVR